jgi:hypothetical protein
MFLYTSRSDGKLGAGSCGWNVKDWVGDHGGRQRGEKE